MTSPSYRGLFVWTVLVVLEVILVVLGAALVVLGGSGLSILSCQAFPNLLG